MAKTAALTVRIDASLKEIIEGIAKTESTTLSRLAEEAFGLLLNNRKVFFDEWKRRVEDDVLKRFLR